MRFSGNRRRSRGDDNNNNNGLGRNVLSFQEFLQLGEDDEGVGGLGVERRGDRGVDIRVGGGGGERGR